MSAKVKTNKKSKAKATSHAFLSRENFSRERMGQHLQHKHAKKVILTGLAAVVLLIAGAFMLQRGSLSTYKVAGTDINKTTKHDDTTKHFSDVFAAQKIEITDKDGKKASYKPADAGLAVDPEKSYETAVRAQESARVIEKINPFIIKDFPLVVTHDDNKLKDFVATKLTQKISEPVNAALDTSGEKVVVTPDKTGEYFTIDNAQNRLLADLSRLGTLNYTLTKHAIQPEVHAKDLNGIAKQASQVAEAEVIANLDGQAIAPDPQTKLSWISNDGNKLVIKKDAVSQYLKDISADYESPGSHQVIMKQPDGSEQVIFKGSGGSAVGNITQSAEKIAADLTAGKPSNVTLEVTEAAPEKDVLNNYPKWIIVNLSTLHLDAYEKDRKVYSYPVSAGLNVSPTITGIFNIYLKVRSQTMRGTNGYGQPYAVPNVQWVNYFSGNYAVHGNYWAKPEYFGKVNSTSGCVGLRNEDAEQIYNWAPIGTPVIVHY